MITMMNIMLAIFAVVLFMGVCGEKDTDKQKNITKAFVADLAAIVLINFVA